MSDKKKILVVSPQDPTSFNGGAFLMKNRLKVLSKIYDIFLITRNKEKERKSLPYIKKTHNFRKFPVKNIIGFIWTTIFRSIFSIYSESIKNSIRIIQLEFYETLIYAFFIQPLRLFGKKIFYTAHDIKYTKFEKDTFRRDYTRFIERLYFRFFIDFIFVWGEDDRQVLLNDGVKNQKIRVIPPIIEEPKKFWKHKGQKDFVFLGAISHKPSLDSLNYTILEIWPHIVENYPKSKLYLILGKSGKYFSTDMKNVENLGFVDDIYDIFAKSAVLIAPIVSGTGIKVKIAEGFAFGIPVMTNSMGLQNFTDIDKEKLIVSDDPIDLAYRLKKTLDSKNRLKEISDYERKYYKKNFSTKTADLYKVYYEEFLR